MTDPDSQTSGISALHVGKYFPPFAGGMENFLADLLGALDGSGVRVTAVVHDHQPGREGEQSSFAADCPQRKAGRTGGDRGSIRLYRVPTFGRLLYAPVSPQFPFWLRRAIKKEQPDILHLHLPNTSAFWAMLIPEARRLPWVIHWHSDVVSSRLDAKLKYAYPFYRPFETGILRKSTAVITTSPNYLQSSDSLAPWRAKCHVVPLGLDPARIAGVSEEARRRAERYWGTAAFRILSVGRLTYYKGYEHFIRALQHTPGARALIVGEGERRRILEETILDLRLDGRVVLTGELTPECLHAVMETCDCFCLPSVERTEAFGMVLVEAMAHGKAAVVCTIPGSGVHWVVQDGETGRAVPPAEPMALSAAFRSLSADRQALLRMGLAGRRRYQDLFRIDRVSDKVLHLYEAILGRGRGR